MFYRKTKFKIRVKLQKNKINCLKKQRAQFKKETKILSKLKFLVQLLKIIKKLLLNAAIEHKAQHSIIQLFQEKFNQKMNFLKTKSTFKHFQSVLNASNQCMPQI